MKELHLSGYNSRPSLSASGEFPFCPKFTHFTANNYHIDDSVPTAFMKAVKEGKFPNLRRIELRECTMNDCEWPEFPEFSCVLRGITMFDRSPMQKLLLKLTELTVLEIEGPLHIDRLIPFPLEKRSVLRLEHLMATKLQCLNSMLKQGMLQIYQNFF